MLDFRLDHEQAWSLDRHPERDGGEILQGSGETRADKHPAHVFNRGAIRDDACNPLVMLCPVLPLLALVFQGTLARSARRYIRGHHGGRQESSDKLVSHIAREFGDLEQAFKDVAV